MLSAAHTLDGAVEPYRSPWILSGPPREPWQRAAYFALRRTVFVDEQQLFAHDDRDEYDAHAVPLIALATMAGHLDEVVGAVRIYEQEARVWYGGRLAVARDYRRARAVGSALTQAAVGAARGLGAARFLATVQSDNVSFFARHHFAYVAPLFVCGREHALMEADLAAFAIPSWLDPEVR